MIDIHCHILPGIDDGAKDIDTAICMARFAYENGTSIIIATSHFGYGYYENNFLYVSDKVEKLSNILKANGIEIELKPGQEIFLDEHMLEYYKSSTVRGLNGSRYLLLELPMDKLPHYALDSIYELRLLGAEVIIAHPERYMYVINKPSIINDFIKEGCFFQINAGSIMGKRGRAIKKTSEILIKHNICQFIATDAHGIGKRRPDLKSAYKRIKQDLKVTIAENELNLIRNKKIQSYCEKIQEKSFFCFL
jgi:protein-tyrosine phosphatase